MSNHPEVNSEQIKFEIILMAHREGLMGGIFVVLFILFPVYLWLANVARDLFADDVYPSLLPAHINLIEFTLNSVSWIQIGLTAAAAMLFIKFHNQRVKLIYSCEENLRSKLNRINPEIFGGNSYLFHIGPLHICITRNRKSK